MISDEETYYGDEEKYLRELVGNLVSKMNEKVSERTIQYEDITFKLPFSPFRESMTAEPLCSYFNTEDCIELFTFVYNKEIEEYSNTKKLFEDYPHITKEFLGSDTAFNVQQLQKAHKS